LLLLPDNFFIQALWLTNDVEVTVYEFGSADYMPKGLAGIIYLAMCGAGKYFYGLFKLYHKRCVQFEGNKLENLFWYGIICTGSIVYRMSRNHNYFTFFSGGTVLYGRQYAYLLGDY
jgi:hypothetical protein